MTPGSPRLPRRALLTTGLVATVELWVREGATQPVEVPVRLQAELLAKVAAYDRGYAARARGKALCLVVVKSGDPESERVGEQILGELRVLPQIGGLPHTEELVRFASPEALAEQCRLRGAAVVYLSVRLGEQVGPIAAALNGDSVLTVAVAAPYVSSGAVLGFDSESGKPRLVVNLAQARRQKVAFKPERLSLARVIQ
jgi:hypothetical protein